MVWIGLVVCLALVAVFAGRPVYRLLKTWRARQIVAEARALIKDRKWQEAVQKVSAAYQLAPFDSETIRLAAQVSARFGQRDALVLWRSLIQTGRATREDRAEFGRCALTFSEMEAAREQVQWLLDNAPYEEETLSLAAEYSFMRGDFKQAKEFCRRALGKQPSNQTLRLLLAQLLASSADVNEQIEARKVLWAIAASKEAPGLQALELLSRLRYLPRDETELVAEKLSEHPLKKPEHSLLALELRLRLHPDQQGPLTTQAVSQWGKGTEQERLAVGRWLNRLGDPQRCLEAIPEDVAMKSQDLMLVRLDAMAALGLWSDIKVCLDNAKTPLEPVLVELFRARVLKELGQPEEASLHWRKVHLEATHKPAAWLYVAQYAERVGENAEAAKAWRRLLPDQNVGRAAAEALIRIAEREGNTIGLRELMREIVRLHPGEPEPINDLAYLNLLLDENTTEALEASKKLVEAYPNYLAYRTSLALAHLRLNQPEAAAAQLDGLNVDWGKVLPGWQAVRVAVLGANGKTNLARIAAQRIPLDRLKREELDLVRPHLAPRSSG